MTCAYDHGDCVVCGAPEQALSDIPAQCSGPYHQAQTGLLFLASGALEISPETGRTRENGVSPTF